MKNLYKVKAYGQRKNFDCSIIIDVIELGVRAESIKEACQLAEEYLKPVEDITPFECRCIG